ncbi:adrenomedullin a [Sardina pilchardus]|uniref:adrenomedullin a n=1 Tax=Sardina pilchardus TaxID=27697 RepID=UPI002E0E8AB5
MSILAWCVLSCFGVLTSARPRIDTAKTTSHSVEALSGSRGADASVTNQSPGDMLPLVRAQDIRDTLLSTRTSGPMLRRRVRVRVRRSKGAVSQSRGGGCSLGTCTVHDLAHRLNQLNNRLKITQAPLDKISPQGYGRRRRRRDLNTHTHTHTHTHTPQRSRRALPTHTLTLRRRGLRLQPVWTSTLTHT